MLFYHLSLIIDEPISEFIPRCPNAEFHGKDDSIPRVCVSKTIKGCTLSAPWGMRGIANLGLINVDLDTFRKLHGIDDNGLYVNLRVYELETDSYVDNDYLYKNNLVPDANITEECWILSCIKPLNIYTIKLYSSEEIYDDEGRIVDYKNFKYEIIK